MPPKHAPVGISKSKGVNKQASTESCTIEGMFGESRRGRASVRCDVYTYMQNEITRNREKKKRTKKSNATQNKQAKAR